MQAADSTNANGELIGVSITRLGALGYLGGTTAYRVSLQNQWIDDTITSYMIPEPAAGELGGVGP